MYSAARKRESVRNTPDKDLAPGTVRSDRKNDATELLPASPVLLPIRCHSEMQHKILPRGNMSSLTLADSTRRGSDTTQRPKTPNKRNLKPAMSQDGFTEATRNKILLPPLKNLHTKESLDNESLSTTPTGALEEWSFLDVQLHNPKHCFTKEKYEEPAAQHAEASGRLSPHQQKEKHLSNQSSITLSYYDDTHESEPYEALESSLGNVTPVNRLPDSPSTYRHSSTSSSAPAAVIKNRTRRLTKTRQYQKNVTSNFASVQQNQSDSEEEHTNHYKGHPPESVADSEDEIEDNSLTKNSQVQKDETEKPKLKKKETLESTDEEAAPMMRAPPRELEDDSEREMEAMAQGPEYFSTWSNQTSYDMGDLNLTLNHQMSYSSTASLTTLKSTKYKNFHGSFLGSLDSCDTEHDQS